MHEFSICEQLVAYVLKSLQQIPSAKLISTQVVIGCFRQIQPAYLIDAYNILTRGTKAEGSLLRVDIRPAQGKCKRCGWQAELDTFNSLCAICGSKDLEVTGGMECYIESIEISEAPTP